MTTDATAAPEQDPFIFDSEQLNAIADDSVIRQGLAWFKDNCVTDLDRDDNRLWAHVEDGDTEQVLSTEVSYDAEGNLFVACQCEDRLHSVCGHGVAVLYAYAATAGVSNELLGAVDNAIDERIKRGRAEVRITPLGGDPWFGTWRAQSITPTGHLPRRYQVHIRSLQQRINYCSCPDFSTNQLGTCKHIEAVLHKVRKRRDYTKIADQTAPHPFVYLDWEVEDAPRIALHRAGRTPKGLGPILDDYFDASGLFKGRLPDDFFRFLEQFQEHPDIDIGEDAQAHARHLAAALAREARAGEIRAGIQASGGHLAGIRARLYPYQTEGVAFLAANGRALLADDMGLGKTLQAIAAAHWLQTNADAERILIVCPASLKHQWAREIERFTGQEAQVVQGPPPARSVQYRRGNGFFIINYELILRDLSVINETVRPDLLILDEAQRIKNWRTKIASAVKMIPSRYAFVLSGTPLENRLEDLYSLMQVVDPNILGPLWRYMIDFHVTDERGKVLGYRNLSELRRRLAPAMLRRDRRLVIDQLPERIEQRLDLELTDAQRELHDAAMSTAGSLAQIAKRRPLTPSEQNRLLAALQQARMACNAAGLVDKETQGSPKLDETASILEELCLQSGLKAVVFSQWEQMTRMVEERLKRMGLGSVRLHGGVPVSKRGELMDRFRNDDAIQVFISTDAGGTGLNLQHASVLVNLDIPWNPAVLEQRIARVHRLGQTGKVQVMLMVSRDSYEEQVLALVRNKSALFDNVVDPDASEDVVGVSKKLLENLLEGLTEAERDKPVAEDEVDEETVPSADAITPERRAEAEEDELTEAIRHTIEEIQEAFGSRVERILGAGGGLLVVMDRVDDAAEATARELSEHVGVALIDPRTLNSLQRLGAASPIADTRTFYDAAQTSDARKGSRLYTMAQEKLKAAELLIEQQCPGSAIELLTSSLLSAAAARADREQPPAVDETAVWLYGEALPNGWLTEDQAGLVLRGMTLSQAPEVPGALLEGLLDDALAFVQNSGNF